MRVTKKARKEVLAWEEKHPGEVALESVTRFSARLSVGGRIWEFAVDEEGRLYLKGSAAGLPSELRQLMFYRATEAIAAVRTGHKEAAARKVQKKAAKESSQLILFELPMAHKL